MDPEQTFIRVQERFSQVLTPKVRAALEYFYLCIAITLFSILVVMHANYVQQPGCSSELSGVNTTEAQLIQIKITSAGLWYESESESDVLSVPGKETIVDNPEIINMDEVESTDTSAKSGLNWMGSGAKRAKVEVKIGKSDSEHQSENLVNSESTRLKNDGSAVKTEKGEPRNSFHVSAKETFKAAILHFVNKWQRRLLFIWRPTLKILESFQNFWNITGIHLDVPKWMRVFHLDRLNSCAENLVNSESTRLKNDGSAVKTEKGEPRNSFHVSAKETFKAAILHFVNKWQRRLLFIWRPTLKILESFQNFWNITGIHLDVPKWMRVFHLDRLNSCAVQWLEQRSKAFEPMYLYSMEKGYFLLPEAAKVQHNIHTVNISISARHFCFGNRWQQLLINRVVGYDTILMNSLLDFPGQGYLYNFQTKEFSNLSYSQEPQEGPAKFGDYLVTKCGVLMMSLFVFFTTTMSVSFTLRETQSRMLKFTVQLQHHARHRLPTFQLIFVHVIESLVFVPIMIGILFFLFEFYDDQLLAFMVLILVWLCELFTLISVRTPISMKFFPRFFLLYFLGFHIYFFSYAYGFSYLALSTTAAFMQHLILYFWNRFEVPALQRYMQNRRSQLQQHPDFHITSSTILASTLHITRLNATRNPGPVNTETVTGPGLRPGAVPANGGQGSFGENTDNDNPAQNLGESGLRQQEIGPNLGTMNSFSSLLLWILGGASSESLSSFLSMFRDLRDQGQVYTETSQRQNRANGNVQS